MNHPCRANCGRTVSGNKHFCMTCIDLKARASVAAKEEEPMDKATHVLIKKGGIHQQGPLTGTEYRAADLYRADGMLIAACQSDVVRFGRDLGTAQSQIFLNDGFALAFLKRLADVDLLCQDRQVELADILNIYTDEVQCPRVSVLDERDGDYVEVTTDAGAKVKLATPGQTRSLKLN